MLDMEMTEETFQLLRGRSKEVAKLNISYMLRTDETSQEMRGWLNAEAPWNMERMLVTDETFQSLRSRSKAEAPWNMERMLVTDETFQVEMLPLKAEASANMLNMLVTPERLGTSTALYVMLEVPLNAPAMLDHSTSPHWSMDASLDAVAPVAPRIIRERSPAMETR